MVFTQNRFHCFSKNVSFVLTMVHLVGGLKSYGVGVEFET